MGRWHECGELAAFSQPKQSLAANKNCLKQAFKRLCVLRSQLTLLKRGNLLALMSTRGTVVQRRRMRRHGLAKFPRAARWSATLVDGHPMAPPAQTGSSISRCSRERLSSGGGREAIVKSGRRQGGRQGRPALPKVPFNLQRSPTRDSPPATAL